MSEEVNHRCWPLVCAECGREFVEGDKYLVVQTVVLKKAGYFANLVQVVEEKIVCEVDCATEFIEDVDDLPMEPVESVEPVEPVESVTRKRRTDLSEWSKNALAAGRRTYIKDLEAEEARVNA